MLVKLREFGTVRGRTRITQAVGSQKTVIDYNGGPTNPGPHRVLYTSGQGSSPLRASPVVACRALSATPLLLSGPLAVPGRGSVCARSSPANGPAVFHTGFGRGPGQGRPLTAAMPGRRPGRIKGVTPSHALSWHQPPCYGFTKRLRY